MSESPPIGPILPPLHPAAGPGIGTNIGSNQASSSSIKVLLPDLGDKQDFENWHFKLKGCLKRHKVAQIVEQQLKVLADNTATPPTISKEEQEKLLVIEEAVVNSLAEGPEAPAAGMARNNQLSELAPIIQFFQKNWGSSEELDEEIMLEQFNKERWDFSKDLDNFISAQIGRLNKCPSLVPPGKSFRSHMKLMLCRVGTGDLKAVSSQCRSDPSITYEDVAKRFKDWARTQDRKPEQQIKALHTEATVGESQDNMQQMMKLMQEQTKAISFLTKGFMNYKGHKGNGKFPKGGKGVQCRLCKKHKGPNAGFGHTAKNCRSFKEDGGKDGGVRKDHKSSSRKGQ